MATRNSLMRVQWRQDLSGLNHLDANMEREADNYAREMAQETRDEARANWSPNSPSDPGNPPAVVSGKLDRNLRVRKAGAMFQKQGWTTVAEARHGTFLEKGTRKMQARPFLLPAAMTVFQRQRKEKAKAVFKVK